MKSYLLSTLIFRFQSSDLKAFQAAHPYDWLLWEPGAWKAPSSSTLLLSEKVPDTPVAKPAGKGGVTGGEALAVALAAGKDGSFTLGRGTECDAAINDGTLSQLHLVFSRDKKGQWSVRDAGSRNGTWVDGAKLVPGTPVPLGEGTPIVAAQVAFTFLTPAGMFARLQKG